MDDFIRSLEGLLAVTAGLLGLWVAARKGLRSWARKRRERRERLEKFVRMADTIEYELKPNGGQSLRDAVDQVAGKVDGVQRGQAKLFALHHVERHLDPRPRFETDARGGCVFTNLAYQALTGYSMEELRGDRWRVVVPPEARTNDEWDDAVKAGRVFAMDNIELRHRDGRRICVRCDAWPLRDGAGRFLGYSGVLTQTECAA